MSMSLLIREDATDFIGFRLNPDIKAALKDAAASDNNSSLSQYIKRLITNHLKDEGRLPK